MHVVEERRGCTVSPDSPDDLYLLRLEAKYKHLSLSSDFSKTPPLLLPRPPPSVQPMKPDAPPPQPQLVSGWGAQRHRVKLSHNNI